MAIGADADDRGGHDGRRADRRADGRGAEDHRRRRGLGGEGVDGHGTEVAAAHPPDDPPAADDRAQPEDERDRPAHRGRDLELSIAPVARSVVAATPIAFCPSFVPSVSATAPAVTQIPPRTGPSIRRVPRESARTASRRAAHPAAKPRIGERTSAASAPRTPIGWNPSRPPQLTASRPPDGERRARETADQPVRRARREAKASRGADERDRRDAPGRVHRGDLVVGAVTRLAIVRRPPCRRGARRAVEEERVAECHAPRRGAGRDERRGRVRRARDPEHEREPERRPDRDDVHRPTLRRASRKAPHRSWRSGSAAGGARRRLPGSAADCFEDEVGPEAQRQPEQE